MQKETDLRETRLRSIAKALTYRITGTVTTMALTLAVTGEMAAALAIGSVEPLVKLAVYYLHERAWQQLPVGVMGRLAARLVQPGVRLKWRRPFAT